MDWNLFWTAFGAIGATVGSVATAAAVIVALWQTRISFKKKLQISFSDDIAIIPESGSAVYRYIGLNVVNIGNRDVIIHGWGFHCENNSKMVIAPDTSSIGRIIQVKLPHKLQIEEGITLYYEKKLFYKILKESLENGALKPNKKICFYVTDSTNKNHYVKTKKTAAVLLNEIKEKYEKEDK